MIALFPSLPAAPASEGEQLLELLLACHDKVRRFSSLTARLAEHVLQEGADAEAIQAAQNILRYFELALPNHHADEEVDVFPALRALNESALSASIAAVSNEHGHLDGLWHGLQPWLQQVAQGIATPVPAVASEFAHAYPAHVEREEREVFPGIARLPAPLVTEIAQRMRARRGA